MNWRALSTALFFAFGPLLRRQAATFRTATRTEDVLWVIMKKPVQATADQLNLFSRMYPMNARPIQASSGRTIKESN